MVPPVSPSSYAPSTVMQNMPSAAPYAPWTTPNKPERSSPPSRDVHSPSARARPNSMSISSVLGGAGSVPALLSAPQQPASVSSSSPSAPPSSVMMNGSGYPQQRSVYSTQNTTASSSPTKQHSHNNTHAQAERMFQQPGSPEAHATTNGNTLSRFRAYSGIGSGDATAAASSRTPSQRSSPVQYRSAQPSPVNERHTQPEWRSLAAQRVEYTHEATTNGTTPGDGKSSLAYPSFASLYSRKSQHSSATQPGTFTTPRPKHSHGDDHHDNKTQKSDPLSPNTSPPERHAYAMPERRDSAISQHAPNDHRTASFDSSTTPSIPPRAFGSISSDMERSESGGHRQAALLEHNRRHGRSSPLPQAVQGAQARAHGPSRDPSIKNEFAKMFAGIGSGVSSSAMTGSGANTPRAASPRLLAETPAALPMRHDFIERSNSTNGSRLGHKRSRKLRDDDALAAGEIERPSTTDALAAKGAKRVRHHHHHPPGHHHHHRHRDETGTPHRVIGDPAASNHHHHHHADGTIHYHTHSHKPAAPAPASSQPASTPSSASKQSAAAPTPKRTIREGPWLSWAIRRPRRHLGSVLYAPTLKYSSSSSSASSASVAASKLPFARTSHFTIPRFCNKENCTLDILVSRFYLSAVEREAASRTRAVWGTDVYTDDSDPLGAAIHAGWIQGDWGRDSPSSEDQPAVDNDDDTQGTMAASLSGGLDVDGKVTKRPRLPLDPPRNTDLHLTLLLLPPLKRYSGTIANGMGSLSWGSDHDGMSFRVEAVRFVGDRNPPHSKSTASSSIIPSASQVFGSSQTLGGTLLVERTGRARKARIMGNLARPSNLLSCDAGGVSAAVLGEGMRVASFSSFPSTPSSLDPGVGGGERQWTNARLRLLHQRRLLKLQRQADPTRAQTPQTQTVVQEEQHEQQQQQQQKKKEVVQGSEDASAPVRGEEGLRVEAARPGAVSAAA